MDTTPFMWRLTLIVATLLAVLLGTGLMDMRSGLSPEDGHNATLFEVVADLDCPEVELVDGSGGEDPGCCIATDCAQCAVFMQPCCLQIGLGPLDEGNIQFGSAWLNGRSILPEQDPPKSA